MDVRLTQLEMKHFLPPYSYFILQLLPRPGALPVFASGLVSEGCSKSQLLTTEHECNSLFSVTEFSSSSSYYYYPPSLPPPPPPPPSPSSFSYSFSFLLPPPLAQEPLSVPSVPLGSQSAAEDLMESFGFESELEPQGEAASEGRSMFRQDSGEYD